MVTLSMVILTTKYLSSSGIPSNTIALMFILAIFWAKVPPVLLSLIPPVSGLLAPQERRPELAALVPERKPGAKISLLFLPSGWQVGLTSLATNVEVRPRPARPAYSSGHSSVVMALVPISTRMNLGIKSSV